MSKLTKWFPGHIKPVQVGVYQQRGGCGNDLGYQKWNGTKWFVWNTTAKSAAEETWVAGESFQNDSWRGLAHNPKVQP